MASTLGWGICLFWYKLIFCEGSGFFQYLLISLLFLQKLVNLIFVVSRRGWLKYARNVQLNHEFPLSNGSDRNVESPACGHFSYLRPPAGQNKICVDVLFPKLLCHKQSQWAVLVVDVLLGGVTQDGVGVVNLLELLRSIWVVWVLVRMKFQRQFPAKTSKIISHRKKKRTCKHTHRFTCRHAHVQGHTQTYVDMHAQTWAHGSVRGWALGSPVALLDVLCGGVLVNSQHDIQRFSRRGKSSLSLVVHGLSVCLTASYLSGKQRERTSLAFWKLFLVVISPPMFTITKQLRAEMSSASPLSLVLWTVWTHGDWWLTVCLLCCGF